MESDEPVFEPMKTDESLTQSDYSPAQTAESVIDAGDGVGVASPPPGSRYCKNPTCNSTVDRSNKKYCSRACKNKHSYQLRKT